MIATRTLLLACALAITASLANARQGVPLVEFVGIPVSESVSTPITADQVLRAAIDAATIQQWDMERDTSGALLLTRLVEFDHRLTVRFEASGAAYSVRYVSSTNMDYFADAAEQRVNVTTKRLAETRDPAIEAAKAQEERFGSLAAARYRVIRSPAMIHPAYEAYVHELLLGVRRHLKLYEQDITRSR